MRHRPIATSTLWQLASQAAMAALSIITVKCVAVGLSQELAGFYNTSYGFLQLFGIIADFGLYAVAVSELSRVEGKERERVLGALLVLRSVILIFSLGLALSIAFLTPQWQGTPLPSSIVIAAFVPFFTLLAGVLRTVFQVTYRMHMVFVAEVSQRVLTVALIGFFVLAGLRGSENPNDLFAFIAFGGLGSLLLFAISFVGAQSIMRITPCFERALLSRLLSRAAPYGVAFFCMAVYRQLDMTLIALLRDDFEVQNASYGFVVRMTEMGLLIPTFLLNSTLPLLKKQNDLETASLLRRTLLVILTLGSVSAAYALAWSRPVMHLLTTSSYLTTPETIGADTALFVFALPLFLNGIVLYCFYVLLTHHAWKRLVASMLAGALFSIVLNVLLIPQWGFLAAATVSGLTHIVLVILLWPHAKRLTHVRLAGSSLVAWSLFSLLFLGVLLALRPLLTSDLLTIAFAGLSIAVLFGLTKATGLLEALRKA